MRLMQHPSTSSSSSEQQSPSSPGLAFQLCSSFPKLLGATELELAVASAARNSSSMDQQGGGGGGANNSTAGSLFAMALKRRVTEEQQQRHHADATAAAEGREHKRLRGDGGVADDDKEHSTSNNGGGHALDGGAGRASSTVDLLQHLQQTSNNMALDTVAATFANPRGHHQHHAASLLGRSLQHPNIATMQQQQQQQQDSLAASRLLGSNNNGNNNNLFLNDSSLRAELMDQLLRQEQARRDATLLAALGGLSSSSTAATTRSNNSPLQSSQSLHQSLHHHGHGGGGGGALLFPWDQQQQQSFQHNQNHQDLSQTRLSSQGSLYQMAASLLSPLDQALLLQQHQQLQNAMLNSNNSNNNKNNMTEAAAASASSGSVNSFGLAALQQQQMRVAAATTGGNNNLNSNNSELALMLQQLTGMHSSSSLNNNNNNGNGNHTTSAAGMTASSSLSPLRGPTRSLLQEALLNGGGGGAITWRNNTATAAAGMSSLAMCMPVNGAGNSQQHHQVPPCTEGSLLPFTIRERHDPLGIEEDPNWLSEFHCFVRSDMVEVYRASRDDCKTRNNAIAHQQVGIRCRFCAHKAASARAGRSSAFPSSLRQIYQSFTMMLRDHFANCESVPTHIQERFQALKDKPAQGATDSKRFWVYSAMKLGMSDSAEGIMINERTVASGASLPPFGTIHGEPRSDDAHKDLALVLPSDRPVVSELVNVLLSQVQIVHLTEAERIGNRRSLTVGLPGFSCRACYARRRLGLCRMFPARRRTLPAKMFDLHEHLRRCTVTPQAVKDQLESLQHEATEEAFLDRDDMKEFFDRLWDRLGHGGDGGAAQVSNHGSSSNSSGGAAAATATGGASAR